MNEPWTVILLLWCFKSCPHRWCALMRVAYTSTCLSRRTSETRSGRWLHAQRRGMTCALCVHMLRQKRAHACDVASCVSAVSGLPECSCVCIESIHQ